MRTDDLIADLAARVTPVRPLPSPAARAIAWLAAAAAIAAVAVAGFGARPDVLTRLAQPDYAWTAVLALAASILSVATTLVLAIPGAAHLSGLRRAAIGACAIWAVTATGAVFASGRGLPVTTDLHWPVCFSRIVLVTALPLIALVVMVRRAAPLRLGWTAALAAVAASAMAALAVQIICPLDDAGHAFLGHFVPVVAITAVAVAGRRALHRSAVA